jgi:hypothetical protein
MLMNPQSAAIPESQPQRTGEDRSAWQVVKSYFYWTHTRGSVQYDVMVTLILLFIFLTPRIWDYGDRPAQRAGPQHPLLVSWNGARGVVITVQAADVSIPPGATDGQVKRALRAAIEPVTGDDVFVEHWETVTDGNGKLAWKVWAHK